MNMRFPLLCALLVVAGMTSHGGALAQVPKAIDFRLGEITVRLTNLEVVTGQPRPEGGLPDNATPVVPDKLLPPEAGLWIRFDYETNFEKSDAPEGSSFLAIGIEIPDMKPWGYQPASITEKSGEGAIGLMMPAAGAALDINESVKLTAYTNTNQGESKQATSDAAITIRCRKDGVVTLSATQFAEIQAMMRKVAELEKKVQALEGKKTP